MSSTSGWGFGTLGCGERLNGTTGIDYDPSKVLPPPPGMVWGGVESAPRKVERWFLAPGLEPVGDKTGAAWPGCCGAGMDWVSGFRKAINAPLLLIHQEGL